MPKLGQLLDTSPHIFFTNEQLMIHSINFEPNMIYKTGVNVKYIFGNSGMPQPPPTVVLIFENQKLPN